MAKQDTVSITVNSRALVHALKDAFTSGMNTITEMLQNARRAGATKVEITYVPETRTLVMQDDGCGIADFAIFLRIAESAWDPETIDREHPFGIGAASLLYNAEALEVVSSGKALITATADLLAFKPVTLADVDQTKGTRITLRGLKFDFNRDRLADKIAGFPLPVILNGESLPREDALDSGDGFIETPVGLLRLGGGPNSSIKIYLQGFEVNRGSRIRYGRAADNVVHLDSRKFRARVPDRDVLVDSAEQDKLITEAVEAAWFAALTADVDAGRHDRPAEFGEWLGNSEVRRVLLNRLPFLPEGLVEHAGSDLLLDPDYFGDYRSKAPRVFASEMSKMRLVDRAFADEFSTEFGYGNCGDGEDFGDAYNRAAYLIAAEALLISTGCLDKQHWIFKKGGVKKSFKTSVKRIVGKKRKVILGASYFSGVRAVPCTAVKMDGPFGEIEVSELAVVVEDGEAFACPAHLNVTDFCGLFSSYMGENGYDFQKNDLEEDADRVHAALAAARAGNPNSVLLNLLDKSSWEGSREFLAGKTFHLKFDKRGKATIMEKAA